MSLLQYLPVRFRLAVQALPEPLRERITEYRFRRGKAFSLTVGGKNLLTDGSGKICSAENALTVGEREMEELLSRLTEGSVYAFEEQMRQGFLTVENGARVGIAGEMTVRSDGVRVFRRVDAVNLRVPRFVPLFAKPLEAVLREKPGGALILSPPAGGKTTFLRSLAFLLSNGVPPFRVGIADEREELWVPHGLCDRISGCPKPIAVEMLTRSMSPEFLICDELGAEDATPLQSALNTGVHLIASAHAKTVSDARKRSVLSELFAQNAFAYTAVLGEGFSVRIEECSCV